MATESQIHRERDETRRKRKPPPHSHRLIVPFGGQGQIETPDDETPTEIALEVTDADGNTAPWFDDFWWTDLIDRWGDRKMTFHIAPTRLALLHMVVLHHLDMLYRVAPLWRVVGHAYRDDLRDADDIASLVKSTYHEVRITDQERPGAIRSDRTLAGPPLEEFFGQIRREQQRVGRTTPIMVRVPPSDPQTADVDPKKTVEYLFASPAR